MKKIQLLLLLLCISSFVFALGDYTVSGVVSDADTGETILGATILVEGTSNGIATNAYGFYSLSVPEGKVRIVASYIGYKTIIEEFVLNENKTLDFQLQPQSKMLQEVVITSQSKTNDIGKPEMGVAKMNMETIKKVPVVLGEVDIMKTLQLLPGVTSNGEGSGGLHVRGGAEDQNLVLLDEAIIYNTSHLFGFFSVFNPDAIKGLKLHRGGIPAKFGGRVSSVLDVRQKDGNEKRLAMKGGIGLLASRLTVEAPIVKDKGSFLLAGRTSYAHLLLRLRNKIKNETDTPEQTAYFYDLNIKSAYRLNRKNKIFLSGYTGRDVFKFGNILNNSYGNSSANLRWNHLFNEKLFGNLSAIYSQYNYDLELIPIELGWESNITNYNVKYDLAYYLNSKIKIESGISAIYYDFNPGEIRPITTTSAINHAQLDFKKAQEYATYIGISHKLNSSLNLQYGLRYSLFRRTGKQKLNEYENNRPVLYNENLGLYEEGIVSGVRHYNSGESIKNFGNLEPRVVLSYKLDENNSLKAGYSRTAQYLHLLSNTAMATPLDVWTPSGRYVKPQLANQYSLGYFRTWKSGVFSLDLETYYKTVKNRIDYVDGATLIGQNTIETEILAGSSRAYGLEILLKKEKGNTTGWLSYTLSKSEQRTLGGIAGGKGINNGDWYNTPYDRTHDFSLAVTHRLNASWSFATNLIFQTGRPVTYPNSKYEYEGVSVTGYTVRNVERLPAYHRIDISATYTPKRSRKKHWKSEWVFGVYNIYNRRNAASISFGQNLNTGENEATRMAIFGIIPSITYNFKF